MPSPPEYARGRQATPPTPGEVTTIDIGRPKRIIEIEPEDLPLPEAVPVPEPVQVPEPAEPAR
jgi:hypothetical protein